MKSRLLRERFIRTFAARAPETLGLPAYCSILQPGARLQEQQNCGADRGRDRRPRGSYVFGEVLVWHVRGRLLVTADVLSALLWRC